MVGKKFDLIGVMIRDPIDKSLPDYNSNVILSDVFSNKQIIVNVDAIREDYAKYAEAKEKEVSDAFIQAGADFIELTTDKHFIEPLTNLFLRRAKKR